MPILRQLSRYRYVTLKERFTPKMQLLIQALMVGLHCRQTYRLNLKLKRRGRAILGDDSECVFNVYEADVIWDGHYMTIPIDEADSEQF